MGKRIQIKVAALAALFTALAGVVFYLFGKFKVSVAVGLVFGYTIAMLGLYLFAVMAKHAAKHTKNNEINNTSGQLAAIYGLRIAVMVIGILVAVSTPAIDAIAAIVAMMVALPAAVLEMVFERGE